PGHRRSAGLAALPAGRSGARRAGPGHLGPCDLDGVAAAERRSFDRRPDPSTPTGTGRAGGVRLGHRPAQPLAGACTGPGACALLYVDLALLVRRVGREIHELGDDEVGHHVVDRPADEDDAVPEQPGVDVEAPFAVAALVLDDGGDVSQCEWQLTGNGLRA